MDGYTLLIADDNTLIRQSLQDNVQWRRCGIDRVYTAGDGREALELFRKYGADVVITDVLMPNMDGIELSRAVRSLSAETAILFISAHDDFVYVQKAFQNDCFNYLLKPVDEKAILKCVEDALEIKNAKIQIKKKIESGQEYLSERFYRRLTHWKSSRQSDIEADCQYLNIHFQAPDYLCVVFDFDEKDTLKDAWDIERFEIMMILAKDSIENALENVEHHVFNGDDDTIVAFIGLHEDADIDMLDESLEQAVENVARCCETTVTAGVGGRVHNILEIRSSFKEACAAVKYRFLMGFGKVLVYKDYEGRNNGPKENAEKEAAAVVKLLKLGTAEDFADALERIVQDMSIKKVSRESLHSMLIGIGIRIMQTVRESCPDSRDFGDGFLYTMFDDLKRMKTKEQMIQWLAETVRRAFKEIDGVRENYTRSIVTQIYEYVHENYGREDLNLNVIAKEVSFSPSYISLLFKRETGTNLFDYIISYRIEKAKSLLRNRDLQISDVGAVVGYPNPSYFSIVFKKNTGRSPKEFRDAAASS